MQMGNHADVERLCVHLLSHHGDDAQVRLWLIESLLAQGDFREAKRQAADLPQLEGEKGLGWRCAAPSRSCAARPRREGPAGGGAGLIAFASGPAPTGLGLFSSCASLADKEGKTDAALADYDRVLGLGDYHPVALKRVLEILDGKKRGPTPSPSARSPSRRGAGPGSQKVAANFALKANNKARARDRRPGRARRRRGLPQPHLARQPPRRGGAPTPPGRPSTAPWNWPPTGPSLTSP